MKMTGEDAVQYGHAVHELMTLIMDEGKLEDRKLKEILAKYGPRRAKLFFDRIIVGGVFEPDPIGTRLYFRPFGTRDRACRR